MNRSRAAGYSSGVPDRSFPGASPRRLSPGWSRARESRDGARPRRLHRSRRRIRSSSSPRCRSPATSRRHLDVRESPRADRSAPRGGDLWIRYPDGTLEEPHARGRVRQGRAAGRDAIAVREPSVHWSGTKALFSMVIGAPRSSTSGNRTTGRSTRSPASAQSDTPVIRKIADQPAGLQQRHSDLRHRRPHPLHLRPPAQRRARISIRS